ncbi:DUF4214 domain-containing protein [Undibacterium sp. TJN19]|uniref:DUF4214 domain-containing protein n=1 Tax=Undibacterium sp. TJN19 TaxID=3413055 RepID=UPI003BF1DE2A
MAFIPGAESGFDARTYGYNATHPDPNFQVSSGTVSFGKLSASDLTGWYQLNLDGPGNYTLLVSTDPVNNYSATNNWNSTYTGIAVQITDRAGNPLPGLSPLVANANYDGGINFSYAGNYSHGGFYIKIINLEYAATDYIVGLSATPAVGQSVYGNAGDNTFFSGPGNHTIHGGTGLNSLILSGKIDNYSINGTSNNFVIKDVTGVDGTETASHIQRLIFTDSAIAFDIDGAAGQTYRLYQAAFGRTPDLKGLGYWINAMDHGATLSDVAGGFFQSVEFQNQYGSNPSTATLITNFYQNVLHRAPDQAGFNYWSNQLNHGLISPAGALASFCESAENQAQVIGQIQNGIDYQVWLS